MSSLINAIGLAMPSCVVIAVLSVFWRYYDIEQAIIDDQIGMVYILAAVNDAEHLGTVELSKYFTYFEREEVIDEPVACWELEYQPWTPIGPGRKRVRCIRGQTRFVENWSVLVRSEPFGFDQVEDTGFMSAEDLLGD